MPKRSAGILLFRHTPAGPEVLLVHPGGPFWAKKDAGAWSIPKGEVAEGEDSLAAAKREFEEETGFGLGPRGPLVALGAFRQSSAKTVEVWALEGDFDPSELKSNTFLMQWPPKSGRMQEFSEVDRAAWFTRAEAGRKILKGQAAILEAFYSHLEHERARSKP